MRAVSDGDAASPLWTDRTSDSTILRVEPLTLTLNPVSVVSPSIALPSLSRIWTVSGSANEETANRTDMQSRRRIMQLRISNPCALFRNGSGACFNAYARRGGPPQNFYRVRSRGTSLNQALAHRKTDDLGRTVQAELLHDAAPVCVNGINAD